VKEAVVTTSSRNGLRSSATNGKETEWVPTPTYATWNAGTAQHCVIELTDAESNIAPGRYRVSLSVTTVTDGPAVFGTGEVEVFDAYHLNSSDPADENPGAPISQDAADLRYAPIGGGGGGTLDSLMITGLTGTGSLAAQVVTTANIPTFRFAYDATYGAKVYLLTNDTDPTSLPFVVRASDYAAGGVHQCVWKAV